MNQGAMRGKKHTVMLILYSIFNAPRYYLNDTLTAHPHLCTPVRRLMGRGLLCDVFKLTKLAEV